jgi:ABC-type glycerol-3-phosphate transport system substrate-binding protein
MSAIGNRVSREIRRIVIGVLSAATLLLLVFGPRAGAELPQDRIVIDYWEKWTSSEEAAMRQIVDDFNNTVGKEKHIYVRYLSTSSIEQKTLVACAAGVPPDVAGLYNQQISQFGAMNALLPLEDMAAQHGITEPTYKKVYWDECKYRGHLYGLVSTAYDLGLYYNKQLFAEGAASLRAHGLDPNRAPRSIKELDAYAKALDRITPSGRIELAGYLPMEPGWYINYTPIWFSGTWWDKRDQRFTFTDPGVIAAFRWVQSYSKRLGQQAITEFQSGFGGFDSPQNSFLAPTVAMVQQGTFFAHFIELHRPEMAGKWGVVPFPSDDPKLKDATYCNCDVLTIPRGSKHPEQAFEFISYVNRQDVMEKLATLQFKISPLAKVSEGFLDHHPNPYIRVFDEMAASPNAHPTEPVPILPEVNDEMTNFTQRLALLQVSPEEGLAQVQQRIDLKFKQFHENQRLRYGSAQ